ncbi:hypothetical protein [Ammoniphilus sp. CFH 90114]|uniref:hypothetical protein n=1 Tax=Ammoniphilus sp. CFH 90114 TaxID=2493665 RepID=UPI00100DEDCF|nr:hypothetical protein [Ammoniphilus sp. CFH 90114]RXT06329.1 hypothetical protein EIZ39_14700 [Ammoniphilus sp. CFH 90114]
MGIAQLDSLTGSLFAIGAIVILLAGSFFSFGILRFFQKRFFQGTVSLVLAIASFVALLLYVD